MVLDKLLSGEEANSPGAALVQSARLWSFCGQAWHLTARSSGYSV